MTKWIYGVLLFSCLLWALPLTQTSYADKGLSSGCFEGACVGLPLPQEFIESYDCKRNVIKRKSEDPRYYPFLQKWEKYYGMTSSGSKGKMLGPYKVGVPIGNLFSSPINIELFDGTVVYFSASFQYEKSMPKADMCRAIKKKYESHFYSTVKERGDNIRNYENACNLPNEKGKGTTGKIYFDVKQSGNKSEVTLQFFDSHWTVIISGTDALSRCAAEEAKQKKEFIP